jgi:hypothetical protein
LKSKPTEVGDFFIDLNLKELPQVYFYHFKARGFTDKMMLNKEHEVRRVVEFLTR